MKKQGDERTPEEIAEDLEGIDFAEIDEGDLKDVFGSLSIAAEDDCTSNSNCGCG